MGAHNDDQPGRDRHLHRIAFVSDSSAGSRPDSAVYKVIYNQMLWAHGSSLCTRRSPRCHTQTIPNWHHPTTVKSLTCKQNSILHTGCHCWLRETTPFQIRGPTTFRDIIFRNLLHQLCPTEKVQRAIGPRRVRTRAYNPQSQSPVPVSCSFGPGYLQVSRTAYL